MNLLVFKLSSHKNVKAFKLETALNFNDLKILRIPNCLECELYLGISKKTKINLELSGDLVSEFVYTYLVKAS